ncbi:expansin EXLX1 family cellulose-binding protein [Kitasatospora cathayae]|uniref:Expansin EXLX1 family cellulose-binding protein n=1 Tax=Kitasatospora cathayae TaxID=3004092 RepID=A0ABY7PWI5_9ACTN|nr:expansin EXLX1 family cellulose-binding protein [Kitasatospora sp. HUAS 3-15]WBP84778.1 expansin EXLX1 family cellulose-binding protein [Kitasatospora sp. HUAS 3-15]
MRATKHAAPQARRRRGVVWGIPLAAVAVGVLVCLAVAFLGRSGAAPGTDAGQPAAAAVEATGPSAPPSTGTGTGTPDGATPSAAQPSPTSPSPTPSVGAPSRSASTAPKPSATAGPSATPAAPAVGSARTAAGPASLAGRIRPGTSYQGVATSYDAADGNGACSFGPSGDLMIAAMNHTDYETSKACGAYVQVHAANGASVTVRIVNECPLPCAPGQLDLSHEAFAKLADLSVGRLPISWSLLSPGEPGTMSVRYKTGSTQWWCGIQVIGHRNPVAALEVRTGGGWRQLTRTDYNYFLSPDGGGCGGPIRVTDIYGEQLTVDGIALQPDVVQSTRVQFARH